MEQPQPAEKPTKGSKLRNRTDAAGLISKDVVRSMLENIFKLMEIKKEIVKEKDAELQELKKKEREVIRKHAKDIDQIEKDVYRFENAIKQICGSNEFNFLIANFKKEKKGKNQNEKDG